MSTSGYVPRSPPPHPAAATEPVAAARLLAKANPARLRRILEFARRGARPATADQALAAREAVVSVSLRCAGQGCLQRSLATALLCRLRGAWPTWCTGVRTHPFAAHAWVEAEGHPVGEPHPKGHFKPLIAVPPSHRQGSSRAPPVRDSDGR
ncbi:lasso peptide biosynthesis B2 protein [Streptomyces sp. NPDC048197]|uniref:lasso peptide biosynthesis B2 protein n=1 Tax=Streptomyces sp. NPDC048197 TaxID=3365511 RepID=UPI003711FAF5